MIEDAVNENVPPFVSKLAELSETYRQYCVYIQNSINSLMNDIYNQNSQMTKSFRDIEQSYGSDRRLMSVFLSVSILAVSHDINS